MVCAKGWKGLGNRIYGLGNSIYSLGNRIYGLGNIVYGLGNGIYGLGKRIKGFGQHDLWLSNKCVGSGLMVWGPSLWTPGPCLSSRRENTKFITKEIVEENLTFELWWSVQCKPNICMLSIQTSIRFIYNAHPKFSVRHSMRISLNNNTNPLHMQASYKLWTLNSQQLTGNSGRGQPLSFTLSFGEIPWFDEEGEIRRCDWSENAFLCMCLE